MLSFKSFRVPAGLPVVLLLATFAAWPFLTRPGLPTYTDNEHHIYRTYEMMRAWQAGVFYPRWAPDLYFGYGYPLFNYYAPLTYYLGAAYGSVCCQLADGPVAGVKFVFVLSAYLGTLGMYLLGREYWQEPGGLVAAAAYALAPYVVYVNPHWRGVAPETLAVALGPWLMWTFRRWRCSPSGLHLALAAFTAAALTLAHNLLSFVFIGLLSAYQGWELLSERRHQRQASAPAPLRLGAALLLGLGLSACLWLPALLEKDQVHFQQAFTFPELQFVPFPQPFAPAAWSDVVDPDISASGTFKLGLPQWLLALAGAFTLLSTRRRKGLTAFGLIAALGMLDLILPFSKPLWQLFPLLAYLQFPWRLLGPMAMVLGLLAAAATAWSDLFTWRHSAVAVSGLALAACLAAALPVMNPLPWANYGPVDQHRLAMLEQDGIMGIGTTIQSEFLPSTVTVRPGPSVALLDSYATGLVDKLDRAALPANVSATVLEHTPVRDRFSISAPERFTLQVLTFVYPGWTAYVDGIKTPITPSDPSGFITLPVPAGEHEVRLQFEDTWPRQLSWAVSATALVLLVGLALKLARVKRPAAPPPAAPLSWPAALALSAVVVAGLGLQVAANYFSPWDQDLSDYTVPAAAHQFFVPLDGNVALLAYNLPQTQLKPGETLLLTLYWKATGRIPVDLSPFVHLVGPDGQVWGQSDKLMVIDFYPTSRWPRNRYFHDVHQAYLRPEAPPGEYQVKVGLWNRYTGTRLAIVSETAALSGDTITLPTRLEVKP